ncbi:MAG: choice-of-anchor A family protein [Bacteroidetes bacterium]|nr:MAG: choice-of-anchor A family protein [Bacteroidota bacterium]
MKKLVLKIAVFLVSINLVCAQSPTQPALGFNVFLENGAYLSTNETDGPVAMGGDLTVAGNYQVSTNNAGNFLVGGVKVSLVIGGKVIYQSGNSLQVNQNGYVKIGDATGSHVWYKDPNNATPPIQITSGAHYNSSPRIQMQANSNQLGVSATNNPVFQSGLIDFNAAFSALRLNSTAISTCTNNATLTNSNGQPISNVGLPHQVKINLNNGINYLNISGTDLNNVQVFTYVNQPSANKILVINVNAPGNFVWNVWNQAGIGLSNCPFIIYNFYNTTDLNICANNTIEGTVFAPFANIKKTVNQSNIEGQVIAKSLMHAGGEMHHAPFTPSVTGCVPTTASFNINNNIQCIYNSFEFTSTGTGSGTLSYLWDFGDGTTSTLANPSKKYTNPGPYTVKLKITGSNGVDSIQKPVNVVAKPTTGFTINDTLQPLATNNFVFTTINPNANYSYEWQFGDGSPYAYTTNASRTYAGTGVRVVCQIVSHLGCKDTAIRKVYITSGGVGSGGGGGLESESLGDLVTKRDYGYIKNGVSRLINYANAPVFTANHAYTLGKKAGSLLMADMIPATLASGDVLRITSPSDLVSITKALEVISVDYTRADVAKAVVLGIKTKDKAYSHAKYICDRLRGAKLLSSEVKEIAGYNFIRYLLQQEDGSMEFGTSFVVGYSKNKEGYSLQTNWLLGDLIGEDTLYNFQVWAANPVDADKLVTDIITKLKASSLREPITSSTAPAMFIIQGSRNGENLKLQINNAGANATGRLEVEVQENEQSSFTNFTKNISIVSGEENWIDVKVDDGYEYSIKLIVNDVIHDVVYMADGNWSLDYDKTYTTINAFNVTNEPNRIYIPKNLSVYRMASVQATSDDYISLYKGIRQGNAVTDLTSYSHVSFFAKGKGKVVVQINRDSIANPKAQFKHEILLTEEGKQFTISLADFTSDIIKTPFNPNDVRLINFSHGYDENVGTSMSLTVGNLSFIKSSTGLLSSSKIVQQVSVMPNPNYGTFALAFSASKTEQIKYVLTDIMGRIVGSGVIDAYAGNNSFQLQMEQTKGLYFLTLESQHQKYQTVKIIYQ